jgi:hypothetical protein
MEQMTGPDGYRVFGHDPRTHRWAQAALRAALKVASSPARQGPDNLRHQKTWFVGVDALPNAADGSIAGVPLGGPWQEHVSALPLHPAQLSIIYKGYPKQDAQESDGNHRYRRDRAAAHVDGLLPEGPARQRFAREFHAYILALPLNDVAASPTVVWPGSQRIMQAALATAYAGRDPAQIDITDVYQAARRDVFAQGAPVPLRLVPGEAALLHPFVLHGTQAWGAGEDPSGQGRIIAFFRPECAGGAREWLATL